MAYTSLPRKILINYLISKAMGRRDLLSVIADLNTTPRGREDLEGLPGSGGDTLSKGPGEEPPNLRIIMSAEQVLNGSLKRVLSAVRTACSSGLS